MASACALAIISGKNIYNFGIAERLRALRYPIVTGRSRKGKRQVQRRVLRKRGAAGKLLLGASGLNPLSLLPMVAASSPEGGALSELTGRCVKAPPSGELASSAAR